MRTSQDRALRAHRRPGESGAEGVLVVLNFSGRAVTASVPALTPDARILLAEGIETPAPATHTVNLSPYGYAVFGVRPT